MKLDIEFAFEGFRILRKRPWAVAAWGVVFLLANLIGFGSFVPLALPALIQLFNSSGSAPDPAVIASLIAGLILPYIVLFIVMILAGAVVSCAVFRAALTDEKPGFGYLRLGGDEFRLILVHIIFSLMFVGFYLVCAIVGGILTFAFSQIDEDLAGLGVGLTILLGLGVMIWLMVRLSLFSVQSFDEKRINLFGSWKLTKGKAWTLFGGYLLAGILAVVVETIVMTVVWFVMAIVMFANMGAWQSIGNSATPDLTAILWVVGPMLAGYIAVFSLVAWPIMTAILVGAPAAAYRALSDRHPNTVEKIF
ncbi:putative membrane protein [Asticcacaulis biprosthecium C19]|uniref:Putative membrane protein n=1 Tax=Asticcacaulis biprosthecium C19 TaxID=715226 RepID=F4QQ40_9CAUL|nr:hypothetical protein [Asticcacaulis biprosthecium]EGF90327.1 putative membrane protein [Asticcacaulis biprosthecium C19]